ncbi:penicillin acylase family protein [Piscinibacter sakaiensis]|uniref:penicillin acylase family protein n=1 Tax=Piscinibacter sakaiensis TaxID=1547922 RepID=UPI00372D2E8B
MTRLSGRPRRGSGRKSTGATVLTGAPRAAPDVRGPGARRGLHCRRPGTHRSRSPGAYRHGCSRPLRPSAPALAAALAAEPAAASPAAREALEAYAAGINAYLAHGLRARPPEFLLLGLHPEPWTPVDSLGWAIMMAWDLSGNWGSELLRMRLAQTMPVERINELLPPYPGEAPLVTRDYTPLYRQSAGELQTLRQALQAAPESGIEGLGSNNWVLAGSRTTTGRPLLANDPHLKLSAPALWYFARLQAPGLKVAGATLPGLPVVVLGQNADIAWGFTNTAPDSQDIYLERIRPEDDGQYQTPEGWAPFKVYRETIKVRGAADVTLSVRETRHGPVISDAGGAATRGLTGPATRPTLALALRWTALDADSGTIDAGLAFNRARSVEEFVQASAGYVAPMQNMVVADAAGRIAMVSAGRVPVRGPDHDLKGQVPAPGWEARYDWVGFVPAGETPRKHDPARGWIATANQRIHAPDYPHYLTSEWAAPYRQQRIEQLLEERPKHDLDNLRRIQSDVLSLAALKLLPVIRQARSDAPQAAAAQALLAGFDGRMDPESAAPLILWAWTRQLTRRIFADELGPLFEQSNRPWREALEGVLERQDGWWCDDKTTPAVETCAQQNDAAFDDALRELRELQGDDVGAWRWGRAHQARSEHRPFSQVGPLARLFELRVPSGGDTFTINAARVTLKADPRTGERYLNEHGPSLRALYDLADPARSRFIQSTGQSGFFFSPHYRDFVARWQRVEDVPVWGGPPVARLELVPAGDGAAR